MVAPIALVINPLAGRGRAAAAVRPMVTRLEALGAEVTVLIGKDRSESLELCIRAVAEGASALVAAGGDGMVHLALQAVAGTQTPLGIIPMGTGNDFARCLGVPIDIEAAADVIASRVAWGRARSVDAVRATGSGRRMEWWACVLGAGFDSAVNERANRMRWPRGPRRYDLAIFAELASLRPHKFVLDVDGHREELAATFVAVGNAPAYGGGMRIAPTADLTDGKLDVTVVGPISRLDLIRFKPKVYAGRHVEHPAVSTRRGTVVRMAGAGLVAYADGERLGDLPVTSECVPGALRVFVP
jgi:diacylglycerol kinase (ATP)